ncbi:GntR family transcriptional regulator [Chitinophaga ginsengisoli]|jgi:DNA-binding transcriptional regulator YhcF (GntR family)|uniref:DNA-binding transcriptional regulator YhcF (GntR family) n=1 Tax=Chitinophaga ginsengisoli TaxID=363837 RepID=A0A2P8G569_9BACT|nr:GntR family transcriptional regulator [Chitinophaga ginsengisoli]PSL29112.1 DNA-binding transcriptional regulator YhcF (GntR family) [Chitinophaga ginsengisoli]
MVFKDSPAIYIQIALYMCEQILLKKWKSEEKIISIRDLGEMIEISPNTVQRAYDFLQQRNIIVNKRGVGFFIDPAAEENILSFRREQFLEYELPDMLRNMYLLKIDIKQVEKLYEKFVKTNFLNKK